MMNYYELDSHMRELTPHQLKIIEALYHANGHWLTRSQIAKALGKRRLTPYDINCLKLLTDKGLAQMSKQPTSAPGSDFAYIYNVDDEMAYALHEWANVQEEIRRREAREPIRLIPAQHA